jgi:hypothetical protein
MKVRKYIGMDVHQETISIAVMAGEGKLVIGTHHRNQGQHHCVVYLPGQRTRIRRPNS